jgi:phospholipid/cholesterol/gamma-HCH transport system substrate-binding protein
MNKANPTLIGAFVLGAIGLLIAVFVLFGSADLFRPKVAVVMSFPGSVKGLRAGSAITFRGVAIGTVRAIEVEYNTDDNKIQIVVHGDIEGADLDTVGTKAPPKRFVGGEEERMRYVVQQGLKAQLSLPNFVTNQVNIEVDFFPGVSPARQSAATNEVPIAIPVIPSAIEEVSTTIQDIVKKLSALPLDEVIADSRALLQGASRLVNDPRLPQIMANVDGTFADARAALQAVDGKIGPIMDDVGRLSQSAGETVANTNARLVQAETTLRELNAFLSKTSSVMGTAGSLIEPGSPLTYEMLTAMRELAATARSARSLINTLERNPNALLVGRQAGGGTP